MPTRLIEPATALQRPRERFRAQVRSQIRGANNPAQKEPENHRLVANVERTELPGTTSQKLSIT